MFKIKKQSKKSKARRAVLTLNHGRVQTPFFMPIATVGAVKQLSTDEVRELGAEIILANTYHLYLRPGHLQIKKMGGLNKFIDWKAPILTDSGGYQVFSLAGNKGQKENLVKITDDGVQFRSHIDGSKHFFKPETSIKIQQDLGVDIMMAFDVCPPSLATEEVIADAVEKTTKWGKRCIKQWKSSAKSKRTQKLFGIVQGGTDIKMRIKSAQELTALPFSGFAIGGLAVGEPREKMYEVLSYLTDYLPNDKPRYLMGVGRPEEIVTAVKNGVDMFDCVIPTREARHGRLYEFCSPSAKGAIKLFGKVAYRTINITNTIFSQDVAPINLTSGNKLLKTYTRTYLYHLMKIEEGLGMRLATLNNVEFYLKLMKAIRKAIEVGQL